MTTNSRIEAIEQATSRPWPAWLQFLEDCGAQQLAHHDIAAKVQAELGGVVDNPGWWGQSVAVAYEQHIGRRQPGQAADGTFQTSVSRATKLDMRRLMDAWTEFAAADSEVRQWVAGEPRQTGTDKRLNWRVNVTDGSALVITSEPKPNGGAALIATRTGLPDAAANEAVRQQCATLLERFIENIVQKQ